MGPIKVNVNFALPNFIENVICFFISSNYLLVVNFNHFIVWKIEKYAREIWASIATRGIIHFTWRRYLSRGNKLNFV